MNAKPAQALSALLLLLWACSGIAHAELLFEQAQVRQPPPGARATAGYVSIVNKGSSSVSLSKANASGVAMIQFHLSKTVDGIAKMIPHETLEIAAGKSLELAPGGYHLMLIGLSDLPPAGQSIVIDFTTSAGAYSIPFIVVKN